MHTKGKWKLFKGKHSEVVEVLDNSEMPIVGWMGFDDSRRSDEEHKANARLIAATPELLEALENTLDTIKASGMFSPELVCIEQAEQAIRKAKSRADTLKGE